jgi:calcium-dependent protein kinase
MDTLCGTPYYMSPDVINGNYGQETDVWSVGVIMYVMLSRRYPFSGHNQAEIFRRIRMANVNTTRGVWARISEEAKDLVTRLLRKSPTSRITFQEALHHPWFKKDDTEAKLTIDDSIIKELIQYKATSAFQKTAMQVLVR